MPHSEETSLILKCQAGDRAALNDLFRLYEGKTYGLCFRVLGNREDALDLCQEVFIRALKGLPSFDPSRPFFPWLKRIAINTCVNHLKRSQKYFLHPEVELAATAGMESFPVDRALEEAELRDTVRKCLDSLPPPMRLIMMLRHYESMSYQEIASVTGLPLGTVKTYLHRARENIRKKLAVASGLEVS